MLSILAVALFCTAQGQCAEATADVSSITECAQVINDTRQDTFQDENGETWYMVGSLCHVEEKK